MKLICGNSLISELVAAHLVATGSFSISDIEMVQMPMFRVRILELDKVGDKFCVICHEPFHESNNIIYVNYMTYFDNIELDECTRFAVRCAIKDISSNEYDMYVSSFNNYILHDISTINSIAYTNYLQASVYSASGHQQQNNMYEEVSRQLLKCIIKRPSPKVAIISGDGYVRYIARKALHDDKNLECIIFMIGHTKAYVYFRDGLNPSDYISAYAMYEGYCEHGQFAAILTKSAMHNLIMCITRELSLVQNN